MKDDCPFTEEQVQWLKDNLRLIFDTELTYDGRRYVVELKLAQDVISSDSFVLYN